MKQRIGGVLVMALGAVVLTTGLHGGGTVGGPAPDCGESESGTTILTCPTSDIQFSESDSTTMVTATATPSEVGRAAHAAPAEWTVTITTPNCVLPSGDASDIVQVPDNGSATSDDLFVFVDPAHTTKCTYDYVETPVPGYAATFDPASPQTLPDSSSDFVVALTNATTVVTTVTPPVSSTSVLPSSATTTPPATTPPATSSTPVLPTSFSASPPATLPFTGSNARVHASLVAGIALLVLGLIMIVGSGRFRPRRRVRHH